jgi:hypothetical protein
MALGDARNKSFTTQNETWIAFPGSIFSGNLKHGKTGCIDRRKASKAGLGILQ